MKTENEEFAMSIYARKDLTKEQKEDLIARYARKTISVREYSRGASPQKKEVYMYKYSKSKKVLEKLRGPNQRIIKVRLRGKSAWLLTY